MYAENLEAAEEVIRRLFDPRRTYKKAYISPEIKLAYLQHYLESRWSEIVGENLARSCAIEKISGSELYVRTANSMLANELYMMQQLFLQKINSFLLGRVLIKKGLFSYRQLFQKAAAKGKAGRAACHACGIYQMPCMRCSNAQGTGYVQRLRARAARGAAQQAGGAAADSALAEV